MSRDTGHRDSASEPAPIVRWRRRLTAGSTFLFGAMFLTTLLQALKITVVDQPRLERLIARGETLPAVASNPQVSQGRAAVARVDLTWTLPDGRRCRADSHAVSRTALSASVPHADGSPMAVLVDSSAGDCTAVLAADIPFAQARVSPGPLIPPLVIGFLGTVIGLLALRYARKLT